MAQSKHVLLVGATGIFGQRLAAILATFPDIQITLTSRNLDRAQSLAKALADRTRRALLPPDSVRAIAFDRSGPVEDRLRDLSPFLVIDATGPFQTATYDLGLAALHQGAHIIDLADAREYLLGYQDALNDRAEQVGRVALGGVSSTPALSSAVVSACTVGWRRIDDIEICIAPAGYSAVGEAVVASMLGQAGQLGPVWSGGRIVERHAWIGSRDFTIPGLGSRPSCPVDTVDPVLFGPRFQVQGDIGFFAGLDSSFERFGMSLLAHARKAGLVQNPTSLPGILTRIRAITRFAYGKTGGMVVRMIGIAGDGKPAKAEWSLLAQNDHGPNVPVLAAAAATRLLLEGKLDPGARVACGDIPLDAIMKEGEPFEISTKLLDAI